MLVEIRSHYWPETPALREVKVVIDGEVKDSAFLNRIQILVMGKYFIEAAQGLMRLADEIVDLE